MLTTEIKIYSLSMADVTEALAEIQKQAQNGIRIGYDASDNCRWNFCILGTDEAIFAEQQEPMLSAVYVEEAECPK